MPAKRATKRGRQLGWYAQAFLTTFNMPDTLERLLKDVGDDPRKRGTMLDDLLAFEPGDGGGWTAPPRARTGDIAFFHYAAGATARVASLRRAAKKAGRLDAALANYLDYAAEQADEFAGRIIAFGPLAGPAEPAKRAKGEDPHWRSRLYAPLMSVDDFDVPLLIREHTDVIPQPTKTITDLSAAQFAAVKQRLVHVGNELLDSLTYARPGRDDFHGIGADTWRQIACSPEQQFRLESDVRGFLADYLLDELKDPGTIVHSEVRCLAGPQRRGSGRADYLVRLGGAWLPVETKLSLWAWPDLLSQIAQYANADSFEVMLAGGTREIIAAGDGGACLVIDQGGVYLVRDDDFVACSREAPLWTRQELAATPTPSIRRKLRALLR